MTRGAVASSSGRAKQHVVHLLFGTQHRGKGREAHRALDSCHYTYSELRKAYLRRVQHLHPDRYHHHQHSPKGHPPKATMDCDQAKKKFVELQEAWSVYERHAKVLKQSGDADASFTMFGVGCSFSDNERERTLRAEITDQACRGWFCSGVLKSGAGNGDEGAGAFPSNQLTAEGFVRPTTKLPSLTDDDLFVHNPHPSGGSGSDLGAKGEFEKPSKTSRPRPSLIVRSMLRN
jgi:curved DNA-binding protein CbpA